MNVSIDTLDIHTLTLPDSAAAVNVVLVVAMIVYIITTLMNLTRQRTTQRTEPLLNNAAGPVVL